MACAGLLAPLAAGAVVVLPEAGRFSAAVFWHDCVEHGVTFYTAVPTIHQVCTSRVLSSCMLSFRSSCAVQ
jgi:acyl-CoA synthetase (AMP-forming)/AMP-acid ligase II